MKNGDEHKELIVLKNFDVTTQLSSGIWVPSIPLPMYLTFRKACKCGDRFWTKAGYEGHYALRHILHYEDRR